MQILWETRKTISDKVYVKPAQFQTLAFTLRHVLSAILPDSRNIRTKITVYKNRFPLTEVTQKISCNCIIYGSNIYIIWYFLKIYALERLLFRPRRVSSCYYLVWVEEFAQLWMDTSFSTVKIYVNRLLPGNYYAL